MKRILTILGFHMDNDNEYVDCPKCGEWTYQDSYCKSCGYSRD